MNQFPNESTGDDFMTVYSEAEKLKRRNLYNVEFAKLIKVKDPEENNSKLLISSFNKILDHNDEYINTCTKLETETNLNKRFQEDKTFAGECVLKCPFLFNTSKWQREMSTFSVEIVTKLSKIYAVKHRIDGKWYAIKESQKNRELRNADHSMVSLSEHSQEIHNEIRILSLIKYHPNIVRYHNAWLQNDEFCVQLEYCLLGSLHDFLFGTVRASLDFDVWQRQINSLSEDYLLRLIGQIGSALAFLHQTHKIIHNDVKPSNILIDIRQRPPRPNAQGHSQPHFSMDDYHPSDTNMRATCHQSLQKAADNSPDREMEYIFKLADFGRSCYASCPDPDRVMGDGRYLDLLHGPSEEDPQQKEILIDCLLKRDVYALGVVAYQSCGNEISPEISNTLRNSSSQDLDLQKEVSEECRQLILRMMDTDYRTRISSMKLVLSTTIRPHVLPTALKYLR